MKESIKKKWKEFFLELVLCAAFLALAVIVVYIGYTIFFGDFGARLTEIINNLISKFI
ncbi:MAG: hypothetical protein IJM90_00005 [Firmicutes bacterium]|nr:hypothetical protein [Bacillota bacterium]